MAMWALVRPLDKGEIAPTHDRIVMLLSSERDAVEIAQGMRRRGVRVDVETVELRSDRYEVVTAARPVGTEAEVGA